MQAEARRGPMRAGWLRWVVLVALIILVIAAAVFWEMRAQPSRNPVEFLPAATQFAVDCDLRPGSLGARQALQRWGASDVQHLGARATELAQEVVDWSGFDLDVRKDIRPWFGGELVVASVARRADRAQVLGPDSLVLIVRTKNARRARASLEKGVKPFAREAYWHRATETRGGEKVTVWLDRGWRSQIAYATKDGCLLVAKKPEVVDACLLAAQSPENRLGYQDAFDGAVGELPREAVAWAYGDVQSLAATARAVLSGAPRGWPGVVKRYLSYSRLGTERVTAEAGVVACALVAVPKGVEVSAVYRIARPAKPAPGGNTLDRVARYAPPEAVLAAAVHRPGDLLESLLPPPASPEDRTGRAVGRGFWRRFPLPQEIVDPWLGLRRLPSDLMIAILPREGKERAALAVAAPAGELPVPPRGLLSFVFPRPATAVVDKIAILATDEQALKQCSLAAKNPRPLLDSGGAVRFVVSVRPSRASAELSHVEQLELVGRQTPEGGEGKITLAIPPRYLLGGK